MEDRAIEDRNHPADSLRHKGYHEEDHEPAEHRAMAARQLDVVIELLGYAAANAARGNAAADERYLRSMRSEIRIVQASLQDLED